MKMFGPFDFGMAVYLTDGEQVPEPLIRALLQPEDPANG